MPTFDQLTSTQIPVMAEEKKEDIERLKDIQLDLHQDSIDVVENELLLPPVFDPRKIFNVLLLLTQ